MASDTTTRRAILRLAWPIVLANAAVPLLGIVDTAVIGNTGGIVDLGAIALGSLIFNFIYWSFGFLRMGTTGFVAQASGAGDTAEVRSAMGRSLLLAIILGTTIVSLQKPIAVLALSLLGGEPELADLTLRYYEIRIWGSPASLSIFAVLGVFVGLGKTKHLLTTQLFLNGLNILLNVLFAAVLGWGVSGIAWGTVIAEWSTFFVALTLCVHLLSNGHQDGEPFWPKHRILDWRKARKTLAVNADIMVRTLFLLMGFGWFTNRGALFGSEVLAANHVLLQLISVSAYLLDGYANATETHVGRAIGTRSRQHFDRAVRSSTELAAVTAVALSGLVLALGPFVIRALTNLEPVRDTAHLYLPWTALYVLLSFAAFQLDGIFIGATGTRAMRNASVLSFTVFLVASLLLIPHAGNRGLWIAFVLYVAARAIALGLFYPGLRNSVDRPLHQQGAT